MLNEKFLKAYTQSFPKALELTNYVTQLLAFQQTLQELWEATPDPASESNNAVWARNQDKDIRTWGSISQAPLGRSLPDGPRNLCGPAFADSKNPEFAVWPSRQCLPVLGSFLHLIPQSVQLQGLQSAPLLINGRLHVVDISTSGKGLFPSPRLPLPTIICDVSS